MDSDHCGLLPEVTDAQAPDWVLVSQRYQSLLMRDRQQQMSNDSLDPGA